MTTDPPNADDPVLYAQTVRDLDLVKVLGARLVDIFQHDKDTFTVGEEAIHVELAFDNGVLIFFEIGGDIVIQTPDGEQTRLSTRGRLDDAAEEAS